MGCAPSKNTSTVHPVNSSNATIVQVTNNSQSQNRTILVQELPNPPTSTPEPAETTEPIEQFLQPSAAAEIQNKLQDHVNNSSNSSLRSKKPKLQRQSTITDSEEEEEIEPSTYDQNFDSNMDSPYFEESCTPMDPLQNQNTSNMSNEPIQWKKPSWAVEGACQHSNPTLRLYGTDSQIEFFKMLDKKIEEGPDFHEESEFDEK